MIAISLGIKMNILRFSLISLTICFYVLQQQVEGSRNKKINRKHISSDDYGYYNDNDGGSDNEDYRDYNDKPLRKGHKRIIGGKMAKVGQFPFVAGIKRPDGKILCSASIISDQHVLSAAHCIGRIGKRWSSVFVGHVDLRHKTDDAMDYEVEKAIQHPKFNLTIHGTKVLPNDVGIFKIKGKFKFGPNVAKIDIPKQNTEYNDFVDVIQIGWGGLEPHRPPYTKDILPYELYYAEMKTINIDTCAKLFTEFLNKAGQKVPPKEFTRRENICVQAQNKSIYNGDSGGPLVRRANNDLGYELLGIASESHPIDPVDWPTLDTNVAGYADWIMEQISAD